ncbi:patatin [Nocardia terpenica]|uniref:patatin-like phospholipase family protein n=1 Tax=Nocardia terpenica TaxID=455432 RepID=UPI002FE2CE0C
MNFRDRISAAGPKRLLSLDGGGIRGALSLEVLAELERLCRERLGADENFVLADYFDYIGGTSTGAIIAAGLACGMPVDRLRRLYTEHGREMFDRAFLARRLRYRYDSSRLQALLQHEFGATTTFGDDRLRTLLMIVLRNASTDSPWPLCNNPHAKYNAPDRKDNNLQLRLWQLVRASTAAPVYFPPEVVEVGDQEFVFVDGGLTMYNNPAFQLFLMATLGAYGLRWPTGEDRMLVVSVGTGTAPKDNDRLRPGDMNLLFNIPSIPAALMVAAQYEQDMLCRVFGRCRHGAVLDREIGDLRGDDDGLPGPRHFTYLRYNAELTPKGLAELGLPDIDPAGVQKLDSVDHIDELRRIGRRVAGRITAEHFEGFW